MEKVSDQRTVSNNSSSPRAIEAAASHHDAKSNEAFTDAYTIFTGRQIRFVIAMAAFAGLVSPLSATIYFPALNVLARDLNVTESAMNLTLLTYMLWQGLAPVLFGDVADSAGRRPVFILGFVIYIFANIGLALQSSFPALLVLRMVQSAGTSSTVAIAAGVAADVSPSSTRGKHMGWVTSGTAVGTAVGPVLGGILSQFLGWRWIFWFLAILIGAYMFPLVLAFPETGRNTVGNGSIPPQTWNTIPLSQFGVYIPPRLGIPDVNRAITSKEGQRVLDHRRLRWPNPWKSIRLIFYKDFGLLLFFNAIIYSSFNTIIASTPYLFGQIYGFDDLQIGLGYIPFGVASFLAPIINGRLLDWNFARIARAIGMPVDQTKGRNMLDFPLEKARIAIALPQALLGGLCLIAYGWVMEVNGHLAAALVLQFLIGIFITGAFQVCNVMIVDYNPKGPSTATAANNLCRCWLGGATGALIIIMIDRMGRGWCFTFVGLVVLAVLPCLLVLRYKGPNWRKARLSRESQTELDRDPR